MSIWLKRVVFFVIGAALALTVTASGVSASGVPTPGKGPEAQNVGGVYIKSHRVTVNIENQLATTRIEQVFVNEGAGLAEGTYLFPLPEGAAVSDLTLYIDGVAIKGKILGAGEAAKIYQDIVRQMRDPVLLRYVGRSAIQADIFPIPTGQERKIELTYSHIAPAENGLIGYTYPLRVDYASRLPVREVSISLNVVSSAPIGTVYSPNPLVGINKMSEYNFRAGFEAYNFRASDDFTVYYSTAGGEISANLLTYRNSADEAGYFLLLITPPAKVDADKIIPKDVVIVLDQSGSMGGEKWDQARAAVKYVLRNLNPGDRFNAVVFSSGYSIYAREPQPVSEAAAAIKWIDGMYAVGGTDIDGALVKALESADSTRQTVVLFLTDGLPTEGITDSKSILKHVEALATARTRIFSFGVGHDVDTFLLDSLSSRYGGTSVYVRPNENIEEKVAALYKKITSPVLAALRLDVDGVMLDDLLPGAPLPDLFAGSQLVIAGRFRDGGTATIKLSGNLIDERQEFVYNDLRFPSNAGGQPFVARLWAQRKIGALLTQIRLNGETPELVQSVVNLSVRFGIITPYTSYLIQEQDIDRGRADGGGIPSTPSPIIPMGGEGVGFASTPAPTMVSGAGAVDRAKSENELAGSDSVMALPTASPAATGTYGPGAAGAAGEPPQGAPSEEKPVEVLKQVLDRAFVLQNGVWVDTLYTSADMERVEIIFLSDEYFALLEQYPEIAEFLTLGDHLILVIEGIAYEIKPE